MKKRKIKAIVAALVFAGAALLIFFLWWISRMAEYPAYEETYLPVDVSEFIARGDKISAIGIRCEDTESAEFLRKNQVALTVGMYDETGESIWEEDLAGNYLDTDSFTLYDEDYSVMLPVEVTPGKEYSIYIGVQENSQRAIHLKRISLMIYTEKTSLLPLYVIVCLLGCGCAAMMALTLHFGKGRRACFSLLAVFVLFSMLYAAVIPTRTMDDDGKGFAQAYHLSNCMLGKGEYDIPGQVHIEEDGLRFLECMEDGQALYRFWMQSDYGDARTAADREETKSVFVRQEIGAANLLYTVPALGLSAGRLLGLSWQAIYMMGRIANLLAALLVWGIFLWAAGGRIEAAAAFMGLPVILVGMTSYSTLAFYLDLAVLAAAVVTRIVSTEKLSKLAGKVLYPVILAVFAALVFLSVLYGKADLLIGRWLGTVYYGYYGEDAAVQRGFAYCILALFAALLLCFAGKWKLSVKKLIRLQSIVLALTAIDLFCSIVRIE